MPIVDGDIYTGLRDSNLPLETAESIARIPVDIDTKFQRLQTEVFVLKLLVGVMCFLLVADTIARSH